MKTAREILKDLIADMIAAQSHVTYFGKDGVVRAMFHAVANTMSDIWNDLYQTKRQIFVDTSEGADLVSLGSRRGITKKAATKSSVVLVFNGPEGTIIQKDTVVKSAITQVQYKTKNGITLGTNNTSLERPVLSQSLADIVTAESVNAGGSSEVGVRELTQLETPIADVTVTNLTPSVRGLDAETDDEYRGRIKDYVGLLNQGTQLFYEILAKEAESTVLKAKAVYDPLKAGTKIYLIKNSLASYTAGELTTIAALIYAEQRACSPVTCANITYKAIEVTFSYERDSDYTQNSIFSSIAQTISDYVVARFDLAAKLEYQDILNIIIDTPGVEKLLLDTLLVNGKKKDVICGSLEVPKFSLLTINDGSEESLTIAPQIIEA